MCPKKNKTGKGSRKGQNGKHTSHKSPSEKEPIESRPQGGDGLNY